MPAVQHECIPQAILGMDVLCQAKSGMGKTAVFVLSVLQQLEPVDKEVAAIIICHTRELAFQVRWLSLLGLRVCGFLPSERASLPTRPRTQICHEFERFSTYMPNVRVANFFGGFPIKQQIEQLKTNPPHAVVGTPGRIKQVLPLADVVPVLHSVEVAMQDIGCRLTPSPTCCSWRREAT